VSPKSEKQLKSQFEEVTIDAENKILGRLATEVAIILRGKDRPDFRPNKVFEKKVIILNAQKIKVTGDKMTKKLYYRHSGYLGHLKTFTLGEVFRQDPRKVIRQAVWGMLPKNKLRKIWMRNLEIKNAQ